MYGVLLDFLASFVLVFSLGTGAGEGVMIVAAREGALLDLDFG